MKINYIIGSAVEPTGDDKKIIVHVCNNIGAWGAGFVLAISKKWPHVKDHYKRLFEDNKKPELGMVLFSLAEKNIEIANMIAQDGIGRNKIPIRYDAVRKGLKKVKILAEKYNASIHMPRIGCGLAGGKWEEIEKIIYEVFENSQITINVYDLK